MLESSTETPSRIPHKGNCPFQVLCTGVSPLQLGLLIFSWLFYLRVFHNSFCWASLGGPSTPLFLIFLHFSTSEKAAWSSSAPGPGFHSP